MSHNIQEKRTIRYKIHYIGCHQLLQIATERIVHNSEQKKAQTKIADETIPVTFLVYDCINQGNILISEDTNYT
jgi:hypothetical protein